MTITLDTHPIADHETDRAGGADEPVVLDGGLLFQPSPVVAQARRFAMQGIGVVVSMPLDALDRAPVTGVTRWLLQASVENRLRQALHAAGYRFVTRRAVTGSIVLDASV